MVRRHQEIAFRAAYLICGDSAEAEDAAQEGFVKAYYALARFRAGAPFRPWLLRIVTNEARNRRRALTRRAQLTLRAGATVETAYLLDAPDVHAVSVEERRTLLRALAALREDDRVILSQRYFLELSEAEMAESMSCAPGTVKSRLSRAMQRLRKMLGTLDPAMEVARG